MSRRSGPDQAPPAITRAFGMTGGVVERLVSRCVVCASSVTAADLCGRGER